jgi:hypothetical protein
MSFSNQLKFASSPSTILALLKISSFDFTCAEAYRKIKIPSLSTFRVSSSESISIASQAGISPTVVHAQRLANFDNDTGERPNREIGETQQNDPCNYNIALINQTSDEISEPARNLQYKLIFQDVHGHTDHLPQLKGVFTT